MATSSRTLMQSVETISNFLYDINELVKSNKNEIATLNSNMTTMQTNLTAINSTLEALTNKVKELELSYMQI